MKRIVLVLSLIFICFSCTDNNDDIAVDESLVGEWSLTDVICFCGFPENVDFSTSKLLFNATENKVTILHEGDDDYFHDSGVFNYELDDEKITISGDSRSYIYTVDSDILTLTFIDDPMIADDEVTYKYARK